MSKDVDETLTIEEWLRKKARHHERCLNMNGLSELEKVVNGASAAAYRNVLDRLQLGQSPE